MGKTNTIKMKETLKKIYSKIKPSYLPKLEKVDIGDLISQDSLNVNIQDIKAIDGNVSSFELFVINSLIVDASPKTIFEFGTFNGRTTLNMALNTRVDAEITTIDLDPKYLENTKYQLEEIEEKYVKKDSTGNLFKNSIAKTKIKQLYGDTATFDFSNYFNQIDFIFIDASHAYDYVINDSLIALKMLRNHRGVILWHDYGQMGYWPGVTLALDKLRDENAAFAQLKHISGGTLAYLHC